MDTFAVLFMKDSKEYDAIVVGSGPNGLAAAIVLQREGLRVLLIEAKATIGGGMRTEELTLPGFRHDVCSTIHALGAGSPFFRSLPLSSLGLEYIHPEIAAAHPLDDGRAAVLTRSLQETATLLGPDKENYLRLLEPVVKAWPRLVNDILAPFHLPVQFADMAKFAIPALTSASHLSKRFNTPHAKALWAGMAAHSIQPLSNFATSAFAMVLMATAHNEGWPVTRGGTQNLANALSEYFISLGGKVQTNWEVRSLRELPTSDAVLFDVSPKQLLKIAGDQFSKIYEWQLKRFRYGPGIFKVDWALDGPIPFTAEQCRKAGTIHLGNTIEEITAYERDIWKGRVGDKPFTLLAQQTVFDPSRAPAGKHTAWAYCHVPAGSQADMTEAIENQVERFAPGFKDIILARHMFNSVQMEAYNSNYVGGDINSGVINLAQLYARPALRFSPYRCALKGLYLCSSSTPPGGGVHGMCGYHAARRALKDIFKISIPFAAS